MSEMTPREIVEELDRYIIGQANAKKSVAIALRNRWRRSQLEDSLRAEIVPKNILLIGSTGVGKTEIARRLAKIANAPFVKVDATKFTEIGYVGREVDSIIRDLVENAYAMVKKKQVKRVRSRAEEVAEEKLLDILLPKNKNDEKDDSSAARQKLRKKLREGDLDEREVEVEVKKKSVQSSQIGVISPMGFSDQIQDILKDLHGDSKTKRTMKVADALNSLIDEAADSFINDETLRFSAIELVEQSGIVFVDEIDKITDHGSQTGSGKDVSREGVQRDLLPIIEGSLVPTKYGPVKTDYILFIASGAFQLSKPSDLIPELQGRLPIRVEMDSLSIEDFFRILTEPSASLSEQYVALLKTEGVEIKFKKSGLRKMAEIAWYVNENLENIGARRLHTIMEKLMEDVSFSASDKSGECIVIDEKYVNTHLKDLSNNQDLARYIL